MNVKEKVIEIKSKLSALYLAYKHKDTPIIFIWMIITSSIIYKLYY